MHICLPCSCVSYVRKIHLWARYNTYGIISCSLFCLLQEMLSLLSYMSSDISKHFLVPELILNDHVYCLYCFLSKDYRTTFKFLVNLAGGPKGEFLLADCECVLVAGAGNKSWHCAERDFRVQLLPEA